MEKSTHILISSLSNFFKVTTSDRPQQSTKYPIYAEQSFYLQIIIYWLRYWPFVLRINIIYCQFIVKQSYEYQRQYESNVVQSFNISVISCTDSIVNQSIHQTKLLFFLNLIRLYVNAQTIYQPKNDIIIYTIYLSSINQPFITITR